MEPDLWTIVLAGGEGRRLSVLTGGVPKQFWRGPTTRSLLELTVDRFSSLSAPAKTVVLVGEGHRTFVAGLSSSGRWDTTLFQPEDRGTAVAVMFALLPILERHRSAVVVLTPSDHGVSDDRVFRHGILDAAAFVRSHDAAILFGVTPSSPNEDYGWITPGPAVAQTPFRQVQGFVEKPGRDELPVLMASGAIWNTMIMVARAEVLWNLCAARCPIVAEVFARAFGVAVVDRPAYFARAYASLPTCDFSHDVVTQARSLLSYVWPDRLGWSDLGTPQRLHEWLSAVAPPAAPATALSVA